MNTRELLSKPWVRILAFLWGIVFPIVFVALPLVKVTTGEAELTMAPIWALVLWVVSPMAVSIVLNYARR